MKKQKFIVFLLFIVLSQTRVYPQKRLFSTVEAFDNSYFDETEVDIGSWLSFYSWTLKNYGYDVAVLLLPDSTCLLPEVWNYINTPSSELLQITGRYSFQPIGHFQNDCNYASNVDLYKSAYRKNCSLLSLPITGISYKQAVFYCQWRTMVQGKGKFVFRIPSEKEWKQFARVNTLH